VPGPFAELGELSGSGAYFRDGNEVGSDAAQSCLDQGRDLPVSRAQPVSPVSSAARPGGERGSRGRPGAGGSWFSSNVVPELLSFMIGLSPGWLAVGVVTVTKYASEPVVVRAREFFAGLSASSLGSMKTSGSSTSSILTTAQRSTAHTNSPSDADELKGVWPMPL
jgi:hypothetical protein